ncbi:HlyD family efflux transporter periplasmic adaptor subunit [Aggregicoccus sp. 17bor-14]|uniref:HlyD family secretion protein n=1 Tax=Myxococcaceae TaxID=31 RepID=UPI0012F28450|nr:HlyD family efflux transporter periplasmic adaptor subunit [Simulacricoccus sp. 17bor-14]MRI91401.1 HlyD family efflux transporter periplasmic adaptor subunit [Aggregicoccus sp. 17bor-14]
MDIPRPKKKKKLPYVLAAVGVVALLAITLGLSKLRAAAPTVPRDGVWVDAVKRGPMVRQVKGPGTLVPEYVRWLTADTPGRVDKILLRPGAQVKPDTVILELANPDVQLQALQAERELADAQAQLVALKTELTNQGYTAEAAMATLKAETSNAQRRASYNENLLNKHYIAEVEAQQANEKAEEMTARLDLEKRRVDVLRDSQRQRVTAQLGQIERLRAVAEFRRKQVDGLHVRAGDTGILQELPLQLGQWVTPGVLLAKVVKPERLKAELRIAETQARDVAVGQKVAVDTRNGIAEGTVARVAPSASQGTVLVEVSLPGELPRGARPDLTVEGTVELERLNNVLYVGRPAGAQSGATVSLFRMQGGSDEAERVQVRLGRSSVNTIEVLAGLSEGDQVVLSDMTQWDSAERVKLK